MYKPNSKIQHTYNMQVHVHVHCTGVNIVHVHVYTVLLYYGCIVVCQYIRSIVRALLVIMDITVYLYNVYVTRMGS